MKVYEIADLSHLGYRDAKRLIKLLDAISSMKFSKRNRNKEYDMNDFKVFFNTSSGYIFLSDEDFNVLMLNGGGELEEFVTCSECGAEGLISVMKGYRNGLCANCYKQEEED